jgi:hypothetical protein
MLIKMMENRAMQKIARFLPKYLAVTWGRGQDYTIAQVDRALEDTGCNLKYSEYAYAMFCSEETFSQVSGTIYTELKAEIAENFFSGDSNFGVSGSDFGGVSGAAATGDGGGND